jgi:ArsR family transcriptional regulator
MYNKLFSHQTEFFKALAHRWRLEILTLLRKRELPVTDIYSMLALEQPAVSKHLARLHAAGLVKRRQEGRKVLYSLSDPMVMEVIDVARAFVLEHEELQADMEFFQKIETEEMPVVKDPVCGMRLSPKTAHYVVEQDGERVYFCASGCLEQFQADTSQS